MNTKTVSAAPCKALVLSGGSNNGAWEIGVLWGLVHYGDPTDFYWDVVSGISAGAINAAGIVVLTDDAPLPVTSPVKVIN